MNKTIIYLGLFFILAFILRFYRIEVNIPPLYVDEVSSKYLALPSNISAPTLSDVIYNILYSPFNLVWLFGFNPLGVRLPSVIFGSLSILFVYLFVKEIKISSDAKERWVIALVTTLLIAILPWHFMISRLGFSAIPMLVIFLSLHFYFYFKAKKILDYILSITFLILGIFFYPSLIIIAPFIAAWVFYQIIKLDRKQLRNIFYISIISTFVIISFFFLRYGGFASHNRGLDLVIWNDVNTSSDFNFYRGYARLSKPSFFSLGVTPENFLSKVYFNNLTSIGHIFTKNYLSFISADFMFLKGDPILRHSTGMVGAFYPILSPFLIIGLFYFFKSTHKFKSYVLLWLILSPVPAAISKDGSQYLLRVLTMMPLLTYFIGLGLVKSIRLLPKFRYQYILLITIIIFLNLFYFLFGYFHVYPYLSAKSYEYGFKELADFQSENNFFPMIVIWDGYYPYYYFRFWQAEGLKEIKRDPTQEIKIGNERLIKTSEILYFAYPKTEENLSSIINQTKAKYISFPLDYVMKNTDFKTFKVKPLKIINYPNQDAAFYIYEI